ncbi:response regulator [Marinomonas sp. IMCC 4694]|uniref:response regulator n=1 Tax=Marinomonas sp. IMCC 4694 TaxID=2605432 RepID=UPI0016531D68|nr:response regulator [Marinomonas sp. IMCC 4694]
MQGISGLEATQQIKSRPEAKDTPVFIMVTELKREELIKQLNNTPMPCVTYVSKPITPHQIPMMLDRTLSDGCSASPNSIKPTLSAFPLKGIRLLLVEDNEFNRIIASELLEHEGAIVDIAIGGQEGINSVVEGFQKYDLVLMDMQMPVIDGLEATRQIRANARFSDLPIIAMTANVSLSDKENCLNAGMNGHIGKPFVLTKVIETILSYTQPNAVVSIQASVLNHREENPLAPRSTQNMDSENIIVLNKKNDSIVKTLEPVFSESALHGIQFKQKTLETLLEPLSCDAAFYERLLGIFEQNFTHLMLTLQEKIDQKAYQEAAAVLHSLKGSSGTIGLTTLHGVLCEAESQLNQSQQASDATPNPLFTDLVQRLRNIATHELTLIYPLLPGRAE